MTLCLPWPPDNQASQCRLISAFQTIIQRAAPSQVEASRQRSSEARRPQNRLLLTAAGAGAAGTAFAGAAAAGACSAAAELGFAAPTFPAVAPACAAHPHYSRIPACQGRQFIFKGLRVSLSTKTGWYSNQHRPALAAAALRFAIATWPVAAPACGAHPHSCQHAGHDSIVHHNATYGPLS